MTKNEPLFKLDQRFIDTVRRRMEIREKLRNEIFSFESQIRQSRNQTYLNYIEKIAAQAGVDLQDFREDAKRRNRIQSRIIQRGYEKFLRQTQELVREEAEHQKEIRKRYLECYGQQIQQRQGNPELKFFMPVDTEGGRNPWTNVYIDPPGGIVGGSGCHEPSLSQRNYSHDIEVGGLAPEYRGVHRFLPQIYVAAGEDDLDVYVRLVQCIFLRRGPLESGRGNFQVDEIGVNLSGVGYSRGRVGDCCPILLCDRGVGGITRVNLQVKMYQVIPSGFLECLVWDDQLYSGPGNHSEPSIIELGTSGEIIENCTILNPDNGGSEPWLLVILETSAYAFDDENAFSEINFSRPESDGLELGCVTLYGTYER